MTNIGSFDALAPFTADACITTVTGMFRSLERNARRTRASRELMPVAALMVAASVVLGASVADADEPASSDQTTSEQPEVAVGLPPVPGETIPDAAPDTVPSTDDDTGGPNPAVVHVAVGTPPVPSFSVPDAVSLSLW